MFKISEVAKILNVSCKTLRRWDKNGTFKPRFVDNFTKYRYYTEDQLETFKNKDLFICGIYRNPINMAELVEYMKKINKTNLKLIEMKAINNNYDINDIQNNFIDTDQLYRPYETFDLIKDIIRLCTTNNIYKFVAYSVVDLDLSIEDLEKIKSIIKLFGAEFEIMEI